MKVKKFKRGHTLFPPTPMIRIKTDSEVGIDVEKDDLHKAWVENRKLNNKYLNKYVIFLFPKGNMGGGKVIDILSNNRHEIRIDFPSYRKGDHIDVDYQDIMGILDSSEKEYPKSVYGNAYQTFESRKKKSVKPKPKRKVCRCKK